MEIKIYNSNNQYSNQYGLIDLHTIYAPGRYISSTASEKY